MVELKPDPIFPQKMQVKMIDPYVRWNAHDNVWKLQGYPINVHAELVEPVWSRISLEGVRPCSRTQDVALYYN